MPFLLHNTSLILISVWVALRQDSCLSYPSTPNFTDSLQCKKYKLLSVGNLLDLSASVFETYALRSLNWELRTLFHVSETAISTWSYEPREGPLTVSRAKAQPTCSVILRTRVLVWPLESKPRPPVLQSSALLMELTLPGSKENHTIASFIPSSFPGPLFIQYSGARETGTVIIKNLGNLFSLSFPTLRLLLLYMNILSLRFFWSSKL